MIPEDCNQRIVDRTSVKYVQVVPAALGDELVKFQSYRNDRCTAVNQPGTLLVRSVVTGTI